MDQYTHIHVLLDRTGSMHSIEKDTIDGFNTFLNEQRGLPGRATISLVQFDSEDPYEEIYSFEDIHTAPELSSETYSPRGTTPLYDAIGKAINDVQHRTSLEDKNAPDKIAFVIITDGMDNASIEYTKDMVKNLVEDKQNNENWQFVFLSADLDSIVDVGNMGFCGQSVMAYDANAKGVHSMYASVSSSIASFRSAVENTGVAFSDMDRAMQKSEAERNK